MSASHSHATRSRENTMASKNSAGSRRSSRPGSKTSQRDNVSVGGGSAKDQGGKDNASLHSEQRGEEEDRQGTPERQQTPDGRGTPERQQTPDREGTPEQQGVDDTAQERPGSDRDGEYTEQDNRSLDKQSMDHERRDSRAGSRSSGHYEQREQVEKVEPEDFNSKEFLSNINQLSDWLKDDKFKNIDNDFPAKQLQTMVESVTVTMNNFKSYSMHAQDQLEVVRGQLRDIKDLIYKRQEQKGYDPKQASKERKGLEERELDAKLANLNAVAVRAAEEIVRASEMSADTESSAVEASLVAEQAAEDARRIQEEYEARRKAEAETRQADEERRAEEERKREEEEKIKDEERQTEESRVSKLKKNADGEKDKPPVWESWPSFTYNIEMGEFDQGVGCVARGDPGHFQENDIQCTTLDPLKVEFQLDENEELVGNIIQIKSSRGDDETLGSPIYVAMPHCTSRVSAISREPLIKAQAKDGSWKELKSQEVHLDGYKDLKFVQAELTAFTNLAVVTRFKRDFLHFGKRGGKVSSNVDARVSFTVDKGAFKRTEHFVLQLQPVDSGTLADVKANAEEGKNLLTCSSIVSLTWESKSFDMPVTMTLPVPPNPVKAKKAAAARAAKEAKMKSQGQPKPYVDESEAPAKKKPAAAKGRRQQAANDDDDDKPSKGKVTKWYMGQYGNNEDDENDAIFFLKKNARGRWEALEYMAIIQAKLDMVQFNLNEPIDSFLVLRTRTGVEAKEAQNLGAAISKHLTQRTANAILKQKSDDLCDVCLTIVPHTKLEKALKKLEEDGYDEGPGVSKDFALNEGTHIEVSFRGNVRCSDQDPQLNILFNSQLTSYMKFTIIEVDKFLQKGFNDYRGFVQFSTVTKIVHPPPKKEKDDDEEPQPRIEYKKDFICEHLVKIPKDGEALQPKPVTKTPLVIRNTDNCLGDDNLRHIATSLGDEWQRVAHHLKLQRIRIQAILRNNKDQQEDEVKYDMLVSWVKKVPRSMNKVDILRNALLYGGRQDLAEELQQMDKEFKDSKGKGVEA